MKNWFSEIDHLSLEIRQHEGFWVRVFNEKNEYYDFDDEYLKDIHYSLWSRKSSDKMTVGQWEKLRFRKIVRDKDMLPRVFFENGQLANLYTPLSEVRYCNLIDFRATGKIYFRFESPTKDISYRISEKLIEKDYNAKVYVSDGLFNFLGKFYYVYGLIEPVQIFPWDYIGWHEEMLNLAKIFSSKVIISFFRTSEFNTFHNL